METNDALFSAICGPLTAPMKRSARHSFRQLAACVPRYVELIAMKGHRTRVPKIMCAAVCREVT